MMTSQSITDFDIQALLDEELDWEDAKRIQQYINASPEAQKRYNELSQQRKMLRSWWDKNTTTN